MASSRRCDLSEADDDDEIFALQEKKQYMLQHDNLTRYDTNLVSIYVVNVYMTNV